MSQTEKRWFRITACENIPVRDPVVDDYDNRHQAQLIADVRFCS